MIPVGTGGGAPSIAGDSLVLVCTELEVELHLLMCSLFKGVRLYMQEPTADLPSRYVWTDK